MTYLPGRSRPDEWRKTCFFLLASLSFHSVGVLLLLIFANSQPMGRGTFGPVNTEVFSVSWSPTDGEGAGSKLDTVLASSESTARFNVSEPVESGSARSAPRLLDVAETDPQSVFSSGSTDSTIAESQRLFTDDSTIKLAASKRNEERPHFPQEEAATVESPNRSDTHDPSVAQSEASQHDDGVGGDGDSNHEAPNGGRESAGVTAAGGRQTRFFGISASSRRVVYVIDASESMRQHHAMELARKKLWESLQGLTPDSQFQIVFFNLTTHTLGRQTDKGKLLPATSTNLRSARQFLTGIQPDSGTDRLAAILLALSYRPDTVFVLTDADAPELDAQELREIQRGNKSRATIHVVEFGIQADLSRDSFLKRLARQNGGSHYYLDLTRGER